MLIQLENISLAFGSAPLLDKVNLQIAAGERICLIGRNGEGKSSLLKIISDDLPPDSGKIYTQSGLRVARLTQELPSASDMTVFDYVAQGLNELGTLLREYHQLLPNLTDDKALQRLEELQVAIEAENGWQFESQIQEILTRFELPEQKKISELSGGWLRRVALAQAFVQKPDLLLLDEPTNHLDVFTIQWLEEQLLSFNGGILFITHDRALLQRLATRIIELDRGQLTSWPGDYQNFLRRKDEMLHAEAMQNQDFDKKLAQEERWIRQGIKARRTRNEGRVRALEEMRKQRQQRRDVVGQANFEFNQAHRSGDLIVNVEDIRHNFGEKTIIKHFTKRIMRGDRIGLLGKNGAGKTTLLNILLGKLEPEHGHVQLGSKLKVVYFDQMRASLDLEKTILENVANGRTAVTINGKDRHVISYLNDFLFSPQRLNTPVKALSGGECNRLLLAKLFIEPANVLVMDEPTNDLDIETLELLEELLFQFAGTILLVSHDRQFLDNIVTSLFVFEGDGVVTEYIGGYRELPQPAQEKAKPKIKKPEKKISNTDESKTIKKIEKLEIQKEKILAKMAEPDFYQKPQHEIIQATQALKTLEQQIEDLFTSL